MSWCSANGICWGSCRSTWTTTTGPGPTYRWPRTHPSHGVCSRRARAGWWRCPAWVGSITNTSGDRREPMGRISGRHTGTYRPAHRTSTERRDLRARLAVREAVVRTRAAWITRIQSLVRREGSRLRTGAPETFITRVEDLALPPALTTVIAPL